MLLFVSGVLVLSGADNNNLVIGGREMVDNQHKKIVGYRDLSEEEIRFMNKIKTQGELVGQLLDEIAESSYSDKRWVAIAKTDLQKGFMAATRSIAQPTSFA